MATRYKLSYKAGHPANQSFAGVIHPPDEVRWVLRNHWPATRAHQHTLHCRWVRHIQQSKECYHPWTQPVYAVGSNSKILILVDTVRNMQDPPGQFRYFLLRWRAALNNPVPLQFPILIEQTVCSCLRCTCDKWNLLQVRLMFRSPHPRALYLYNNHSVKTKYSCPAASKHNTLAGRWRLHGNLILLSNFIVFPFSSGV